jgi:hypothetical protein
MSVSRFGRLIVLLPAAMAVVVAILLFDNISMFKRGPISLDWTRPVVTESEAPISNIAGYTIHCWAEGGLRTHTIRIEDASVTHYEIDALPPGRYQCAVSAFTDDEIESALSNFVARTVN